MAGSIGGAIPHCEQEAAPVTGVIITVFIIIIIITFPTAAVVTWHAMSLLSRISLFRVCIFSEIISYFQYELQGKTPLLTTPKLIRSTKLKAHFLIFFLQGEVIIISVEGMFHV